jgi:hypothetical protein
VILAGSQVLKGDLTTTPATNTTADFTMPVAGNSALLQVTRTDWMTRGTRIAVADYYGGKADGFEKDHDYLTITAVVDDSTVTVQNDWTVMTQSQIRQTGFPYGVCAAAGGFLITGANILQNRVLIELIAVGGARVWQKEWDPWPAANNNNPLEAHSAAFRKLGGG